MITNETDNETTTPTIHDWFEQTYLPTLQDRGLSSDRLGELRQAISRWKWWCNQEYRIENPVLRDLTAPRLAAFRRTAVGAEIPDKRGKPRKASAGSINKTIAALQQIANAAAEDESTGAQNVKVRKIAQPAKVDKIIIPDAALSKILEACKVADWPRRTPDGRPAPPPDTLWRFLVVWFVNYGMRTQDLVAYDSDRNPIRWANVTTSPENPHHDGVLECPYGWLVFTPQKTARAKPQPLVLPLNATTRHWMDLLAEQTPGGPKPDRPIAPMPTCSKLFYQQWKKIVAAAGVRPKPRLDMIDGRPQLAERSYRLKHLRCTAATRNEDHGASLGYPGVGQLITGHDSDRSQAGRSAVFGRHYHSPEKQVLETLLSLPQPDGFSPTPAPIEQQPTPAAERPRFRIVG